jgi:hypothetical protein
MKGARGDELLALQRAGGILRVHFVRVVLQATGGVITVAGDTLAQVVAKTRTQDESCGPGEQTVLDWQRSASMLGWGTIVSGGALYYWFRFLDRLFPPERNTLMRVLAKVGVNQVPSPKASESKSEPPRKRRLGGQKARAWVYSASCFWLRAFLMGCDPCRTGRLSISSQWCILRCVYSAES